MVLNQPTADIPSNYSRLIAHELGLNKADLPPLLLGTGLSVEALLDEQTMINGQQQLQLLSNALTLSGDSGFGLLLGQRLIPSTHGALGFMAFSSPNLYTALQAVQVFVPTRLSFVEVHTEEAGGNVRVWARFTIPMDEALYRALVECFLVVLCKLGEFIVGRPLADMETYLDYAAPSYAELYQQYCPGVVTFSADEFGVRLPLALCREPNASANHENYLLALQQCEKQRSALQSDRSSYRYRVERMLIEHPPGSLNEEKVAAAMFMSKRSLTRRLKEEDTGFRAIREQLLAEQAANYLCETPLSVEAIATLLGYHDSANFRRAFKRWFGNTPAGYREALISVQ